MSAAFLAAVVLGAALLGAERGGAAPLSAAAQPPAVLVVGDSLSAAYGLPLEAGWVALLERRLAERGYPHRVVNASISGDTTSGGATRLPAALERHRPAVVVIELGGNDGLRGIPLDVTRGHLERMVDAARTAGARVLLLGMRLPPNLGPRYTEAFHAVFSEVAASREVALVPFFLEGVGGVEALMQPDGLHPTAAAQPRLLENVWPRLAALIDG